MGDLHNGLPISVPVTEFRPNSGETSSGRADNQGNAIPVQIAQILANLGDRNHVESISSSRAIAIFPKAFELQGFLCTLGGEDYLIEVDDDGNRECYIVHYKLELIRITIHCFVINSSDIDFSFELGHLLDEVRADITKNGVNVKDIRLLVFLMGTAGASFPGYKMGEAFHVTTAIKVDRGEIKSQDGKLIMTNTKKSVACSRPAFLATTTICSNHIAHCKSEELYGSSDAGCKDSRVSLMDMETFEFFKTCELNKAHHYQCFRVISDMFLDYDNIEVSNKARKCIKFDKLRDVFFSYIKALLGHTRSPQLFADLFTMRPNLLAHKTFLIGRFEQSRNYRIRMLLREKSDSDAVLKYVRLVGDEDILIPLVRQLAEGAKS